MTSTSCNLLVWSLGNSSPSPIDFDINWWPPTDCSTTIIVRLYLEPFNDSRTSTRLSFMIQSLVPMPTSITPFKESLFSELDIYFSDHNFDSKSAKYMVTDVGIEVMSRKLRRLRKIDITGQVGCSDRSLIAFSSNYGDHDRVLSSISTAGIPLEKILIYEDSGLSLYGLSTFLCACPSLTHLTLHDIDFLNDDSMRDLCQYLSSLVYTKLSCSTLTATTFFLLTKECHVLSEIDLGFLKLQVEDDLDLVLERNYRIRSLNLGFCESNDEFLEKNRGHLPQLTDSRSYRTLQIDNREHWGNFEVLPSD